MLKAEVVTIDEHGGFAIRIIFDEPGKFRLDNVTAANKGKRIVVMAQWTEVRWLAAPKINRRISDGVFVFTPDASREEAERIVNGLNNVIKKVRKPFVI
jgi:preprotein translocase subunit SecD